MSLKLLVPSNLTPTIWDFLKKLRQDAKNTTMCDLIVLNSSTANFRPLYEK